MKGAWKDTTPRESYMKLRGAIGLKLLAPFFIPRMEQAKNRVEEDHQPVSYHKDWWKGHSMAYAQIIRDIRKGEPLHLDDVHEVIPPEDGSQT